MRAIISTLFIHENGLQTHIEQRCVVYVFCSFALAIPEEVDGMFFFFYFCLSFVANGSILTCLIERAFGFVGTSGEMVRILLFFFSKAISLVEIRYSIPARKP